MTAIIILNWNGFVDTIDCLTSLYQIETDDFFVVVVDNGSIDNSVEEIMSWVNNNKISSYLVSENSVFPKGTKKKDFLLYKLKENYGFAKGNNKGVELALWMKPDCYLLLNNDTVVEIDFLNRLTQFVALNPQYKVLTPLIKYYTEPNIIWNCGGRLFAGFRKYYYANELVVNVKEKSHINISFVTGCALFFVPEILENDKVFVEKFFFGEEDFDFSLRMKKAKNKMACVVDSQIFHKVSSSTIGFSRIGKVYIHYLNRFINIRHHYGDLFFFVWSSFYCMYIFLLLLRNKYTLADSCRFLLRLRHEAIEFDEVDKSVFLKYCS